jgi:CRISPR-associated protein Csb2
MLALVFTFPTGRFHATPWGRHVNEADVAWPPEPWRIVRALIAVYWRKGDRARFPEALLAGLVERLSETPPHYRLPETAAHAHARHYMPQAAGAPTLVFDAFARFAADEELVAAWPGLDLTDGELALLDHLAGGIGYFGRAESWAECRVLTGWNGEFNCRPAHASAHGDDGAAATGSDDGDPVRVIAPLPAGDYAAERLRLPDRARRRVLDGWTGAAKPTDKAVEKRIATLAATLPVRLADAMALDTADFQRQGWSRPPASRDVLYHRVPLSPVPRRPSYRAVEAPPPTVARFLLAGRPQPPIEDAVRIGELMRRATLARFGWNDDGRPNAPAVFSGRGPDGRPLSDPTHEHAFWLPEDADGDGLIDHITVFARGGFDPAARRALDGVTRLWLDKPGRRRTDAADRDEDGNPDQHPARPEPASREWRLALEGFGREEDFMAQSRLFGEGTAWRSVTPFLAAGHLKRVADPYAIEIRRLLVRRGLVTAEQAHAVMVKETELTVAGRVRRPVEFHRFRSTRGEPQTDPLGRTLEITLPDGLMLPGPLALGYGCHFGLGLFERLR